MALPARDVRLRVTMLLYGEADRDSRVRREARTLVEQGHAVTVVTLALTARQPYELDGARIIPVVPARRATVPGNDSPFRGPARTASRLRRWVASGRWALGYGMTFIAWARTAARDVPPADVWHGHDLLGLLAAWWLRRGRGGALVYDSHELFLEAGSAARLPGPARSILRFLEGRASRAARAVITVNQPIARELRQRYRVDPVVVMNCPPLRPPPPRRVLRSRLGLAHRPVVIHHGVLGPGRGLDELATALPGLPAGTAVVLLGDGPLFDHFAALAARPDLHDRLYVVPAVPSEDVPSWIADADVGVIPFQAVDRNNTLATPNKLFEYLEAGVPMVVSDFPEMGRIVRETGAGLAVDTADPAVLSAGIRALLEEPAAERAARRAAARHAAETSYNWESQAEGLIAVYEAIAAGPGRSRDA